MKKLATALLIGALSACVPALSQEAPPPPVTFTLTWDVPTERENGEALTQNQIWGYRVYSTCTTSPTDVPGGSTTAFTVPITLPFDCTYEMTTIDTAGLESVKSDSFRVMLSPPKKQDFTGILFNQ